LGVANCFAGCRKGNRECEFPQGTSSSKRTKTGEHRTTARTSAGETDESKLETIRDESEGEEDDHDDDHEDEEEQAPPLKLSTKLHKPSLARMRTKSLQGSPLPTQYRQKSDPLSNVQGETNTPLTEASASELETPPSAFATASKDPSYRWMRLKPDLKPDMQMYLRFQYEHMNSYHYLCRLDPEDFFHVELIDLALQFEPLLYAVVAYAAYHHTLRLPDSEAHFKSFWKYYCKSIVKLRKWLLSNDDGSDLVLLTVLQLAVFEEFLGDWTNIAVHFRAAYEILTTKHTPQSIMETSRGRRIFDLYAHFDVYSALIAVKDTVLDSSWLIYSVKWYEARAKPSESPSIESVILCYTAQLRLIGRDVAGLFANANASLARLEDGRHPKFTIDEISKQLNGVLARLHKLRCEAQQLHYLSTMDPNEDQDVQANKDDVFPSSRPLFKGALWSLNYFWIEWYGVAIMFESQQTAIMSVQALQTQDPPVTPATQPTELETLFQTQCSIFSAIKNCPTAPEGALHGCHACIGLSTVLLPRTAKYTTWNCQQLAHLERMGYVWPPPFRKRMALHWNLPEVEDWWLPNGEGKTRLLDEIRMVVEDRIRAVAEAGTDDGKNDLREIKGLFAIREVKGLFSKMTLDQQSNTDDGPDPAYIDSTVGSMSASGMANTPESSSADSTTDSSPPADNIDSDLSTRMEGGGHHSQTSASINIDETPMAFSNPAVGNRMSGIWQEQRWSSLNEPGSSYLHGSGTNSSLYTYGGQQPHD